VGAHRFERHAGRRTVGFAVIGCLALGLPASALASPPSVATDGVTATGPTIAVVSGNADPQGQLTMLHADYALANELWCASHGAEGKPVETTPYELGSGNGIYSEIHVPLEGLTPVSEYCAELVASNESGTAYGGQVRLTTPLQGPPVVESESVSNIAPTDATVEAKINPGDLQTTYEVWVGTISCIEEHLLNDCQSTGQGEIVGTIPASSSSQTVRVDVATVWHRLSPNSEYVFSVRATNSAGKAYGQGRFFTTAAGSSPSIESESVSNLTSTDATLEGQINTEGLETTYNFYLQEAPLCFKAIPPCERPQHEPIALPAGKLLGSFVGQSVSVELNSADVSLSPGEHYEYWVTATSAAGTTTGPAQEFTAPEEKAQPLNTTTPSGTNGNNQATSSTPTGSGGSPAPGVTPHGPQIVCLCNCARGCHGKKVSPKHLTRTQKLSKALKACAKKPKRKRAACQKQAPDKYATTASKAKKR
jgi:hypothetical protein